MSPEEPGARDAGDGPAPPTRSPLGDRWAVLVGISAYQDERLTLRYARRDAEQLHEFLLTEAGGAFAPDRIRLLLDADATMRNVTRAIRTFLSKTRDEDLVLIYFACHGAPDASVRAEPLYILTHDTDLDDIAGTAMPMDELQWNLRHYVEAERVVILADTCHSAGVATEGARGLDPSAAALNTYLDRLSKTTPGVAFLTSARATQRSFEDERWGGGHGAFTWFLLEGMRGKADGHGGRPRDGIVTLGELADYVHDKVFEATSRRQEPNLGAGRYDMELPLAVAGGLDAEQHVALARALMEVGWLLDDPAPFRCAAREASRASEVAAMTGATVPLADALAGEALLAAGAPADAEALLGHARERFPAELPPASSLHHGLALAALGREDEAAGLLAGFAERAPEDPEAVWAGDYAGWLRSARGSAVHAVLVGIGEQVDPWLGNLAGPPNDVLAMRELLTSTLGVAEERVRTLKDADATAQAIVAALQSAGEAAGVEGTVLFYFSGHGLGTGGRDGPWLITYDAPEGRATGISPADLHRVIAAVPGAARVLLIDTHGSQPFTDLLVGDPVGTALVGSAPGTIAYEVFDHDSGRHHGAFTRALVSGWQAAPDPLEISWGALRAAIQARIETQLGSRDATQTPALIGDPAGSVLRGGFPGADCWRQARLGPARPLRGAARALAEEHGWTRVLARERLAAGRVADGLEALKGGAAGDDPWPLLDAAATGVRQGDAEIAGLALAEFEALEPSRRWDADPAAARRALDALAQARPRALLVGIEVYADPAAPQAPGARADVAAMHDLLTGRGFAADDIVVLEDDAATRAAILRELGTLAAAARGELAVFFVAAVGSRSGGAPSVLSHDARTAGVADLTLQELAAVAADAPDLVTIIDAGAGSTAAGAAMRSAEPSAEAVWAARDLSLEPPAAVAVVGAVTILAAVSEQGAAGAPSPRVQTDRGVLTTALVDAMNAEAEPGSYADWAARAPAELGAVAMGPARAERPLVHRSRRDAASAALRQLRQAPARVAEELGRRAAARSEERGEQSPLTYLEIGLALAAADRPADAARLLRSARNLYDDDSVRAEQATRDPYVDRWRLEARYHLGRVLQESGERPEDLSEAVSSLEHAHGQAPTDPRILLYLGLAVRDQVERQSLVQAAALLRAYVDAGAPLGRLDEITTLIEQPPVGLSSPAG